MPSTVRVVTDGLVNYGVLSGIIKSLQSLVWEGLFRANIALHLLCLV